MSKSQIEVLLSSFPRFIDSSTQHTTIESDTVRYVYQPLEELYMVLITTKHSNILQDIETLHLFAQVVSSICRTDMSEQEISRNAFELLSAFDEIVCLGYRENLTLPQVRSILEMESHEEKIQEIIARVYFYWWEKVDFRIKNRRPVRRENAGHDNWKCNDARWQSLVPERVLVEVSSHSISLLEHHLPKSALLHITTIIKPNLQRGMKFPRAI